MLRLDPVGDREEHAELDAIVADERPESLADFLGAARPTARELGLRVRNLGLDRWDVWARDTGESAIARLGDARCLVLDLGSLDTHEEQALVAGAVLGTLWERRAERKPVLIVIDEAHNVCPSDPPDALTRVATEHAVRIAAEGRKFGLYLLVCTQRPQKVQENIVSQCDNLVLMRMASEADLAYTGDLLSFAPRALLDGATAFRLGEALVAGKLASHPALIRFGRRVAEEGGGDVAADWASSSTSYNTTGRARTACSAPRRPSTSTGRKPANSGRIASPRPTSRSVERAGPGCPPSGASTRSASRRMPGVWPAVDQNSTK
jgi:hypothetical protein